MSSPPHAPAHKLTTSATSPSLKPLSTSLCKAFPLSLCLTDMCFSSSNKCLVPSLSTRCVLKCPLLEEDCTPLMENISPHFCLPCLTLPFFMSSTVQVEAVGGRRHEEAAVGPLVSTGFAGGEFTSLQHQCRHISSSSIEIQAETHTENL